jgi:hypothetical protein
MTCIFGDNRLFQNAGKTMIIPKFEALLLLAQSIKPHQTSPYCQSEKEESFYVKRYIL